MNLEEVPIVILAGGLATRLYPITEKVPKALLEITGIPFADYQLKLLKRNGFKKIIYSVAYLGERIQNYVGDGSRYGLNVSYVYDGNKLLGTGGAIKKIAQNINQPFFITYGDTYLPVDYKAIWSKYESSQRPWLMTVFKNDNNLDQSNVIFNGEEVLKYSKKEKLSDMKHIEYGLLIGEPQALLNERREAFDLADLLSSLVADKQMAAYEVYQRFYEIGSKVGLKEFEELVQGEKLP